MGVIHGATQGYITKSKGVLTRTRSNVTGNNTVSIQWNTGNTSLTDVGTAGVSITNAGGVSYSSASPYSSGKSYDFTKASNSYISSTNSAFTLGVGDFTIDAYIYFDTKATTYNCIAEFSPTGGGRTDSMVWFVDAQDSNKLKLYSNGGFQLVSTVGLANAQWYHVALVRSNGTTTQYINGTSSGGTTTGVANILTSNLTIGRINDATADVLDARIANWVLIKGTAIYSGNFTPHTTEWTSQYTLSSASITNSTYGIYQLT